MANCKEGVSSKPFLRWAGGKTWLTKYLPELLNDLPFHNYHEPFLGSGAVFFYVKPETAMLSDVNAELINAYIQVKQDVEEVIAIIKRWEVNETEYYRIRSLTFTDPSKRAARFIYLNRTSFNGIYRVNKAGKYNVPYGKNDKYQFDFSRIRNASILLQHAEIRCCSFEQSLENVQEHDLVFLDPPYTVSHNNNGFIEYNKKLFSIEDQQELKHYVDTVDRKNAYYILTNAHHAVIEQIFSTNSTMLTISRNCTLGGKRARRGITQEYIFTNIPGAHLGRGL